MEFNLVLKISKDQQNTLKNKWERSGPPSIAVDVNSAVLQLPDSIETKIPLAADHSTIVKFSSKEDTGYRIAVDRLKKFEKAAVETVSARFHQGTSHKRQRNAIDAASGRDDHLSIPDHDQLLDLKVRQPYPTFSDSSPALYPCE